MTEREGEWEMTTFPMISYRQFDQWMEQGKIAQLVDLREPWMFEQDRIWGSVNIPYDELENLMGEIRKDGGLPGPVEDGLPCRGPGGRNVELQGEIH